MTTPPPPSNLNLAVPPLTECNYPTWLTAATQAAKQCLPTNGPLGGLGLLLPPDEFIKLSNGEPYQVLSKPARVTNAETRALMHDYEREQIALGALTTSVYASIPLSTQQTCPGYHPRYGTALIDLPIMMTHVTNKYGDANLNVYNRARAALQGRYVPGSDIDIFLAGQVENHHACLRSGNPLNDVDKVNFLIDAVGGRSGPFSFTITQFEADSSILAHRTFEDIPTDTGPTKEGLASRIRKAAARLPSTPGPPAGTAHDYYGAAAVMDTLKEILPSMMAQALGSTPAANATTDRPPDRKRQYCWTHGLCAHPGSACRQRAPGHDTRATLTNKRGGSKKNCK